MLLERRESSKKKGKIEESGARKWRRCLQSREGWETLLTIKASITLVEEHVGR